MCHTYILQAPCSLQSACAVFMVALGEQLHEVGVRTKVKGRLTFPVFDMKVGSVGCEEDSN